MSWTAIAKHRLGVWRTQRRGASPGHTLPKTNIAPENGWLEYYFPIAEAYFQVLC